MKDGAIKNDGTSRLIKANLPATYEEMRTMAANGTLPMDILFNAAGWDILPDFLNKANLLTDETAARFGLDSTAVPNKIFDLLKTLTSNNTDLAESKCRVSFGSYTGYGATSQGIQFDFNPYLFIVGNAKNINSNLGLIILLRGTAGYNATGGFSDAGNDVNAYWHDNGIVSWAASTAGKAANESGTEYFYVAFGLGGIA